MNKKRKKTFPNILWIMTDEQRNDSLGCYGSEWAITPNIDRLAEEGTMFINAVTPAPLCVAARLSILTGRYPHEVGIWNNVEHGISERELLTSKFTEAGYKTATFGKQHYNTLNRAFETEEEYILHPDVSATSYNSKYPMEDYDVVQYPGRTKWILAGRLPIPESEKTELILPVLNSSIKASPSIIAARAVLTSNAPSFTL